MRTGKYEDFLIISEKNRNGSETHTVHSVFHNYIPVVRFDPNNLIERRIAAIDLVERLSCSHSVAGNICGFHRNTVSKLCQTKIYLGIEAALKDNRGLKSPYKYTKDIKVTIQELLNGHPDWSDQRIADQASSELAINISRSAIARIRTASETSTSEREMPKEELLEMGAALLGRP